MSKRVLPIVVMIGLSLAHSLLGDPKPTVARPCRLGPLHGDLKKCPGPCDLGTPGSNPQNSTSPQNPAQVYHRGQLVSIKYQRNNHGPGGFVRLSLVPVSRMMDKHVHNRNAFHYSCWGAVVVEATPEERFRDKQGFSIVGGDGKLHNLPVSYYEVKVKIPAVVPDGVYILGWVWYGGVGGSVIRNTPAHPNLKGHFADYWSCSYVKVQGGAPLQRRFTPRFEPNLRQFWGNGCVSANDAPGRCRIEPCTVPAKIQRPLQFKDGQTPKDITAENFGARGV